ncbi:hypothetical protein H0E84_14465 [Luteimonas sp. SJ-92]|uniref:Secreted protein n=1 Tax=Luteimonas salinisoli TaxID=2752307 RepID=A0A853JGH5_9GAMM|nr:hypothetical protein [Luteimonas salinisoli]
MSMHLRLTVSCMALALVMAACRQPPPAEEALLVETEEVASADEGGAVSIAPVEPDAEPPEPVSPDERQTDWSPLRLDEQVAAISCELDYVEQGDGEPLLELEREAVIAALAPCEERGVTRLRYKGRITAEFTALMERVTEVADELGIGKRVLDIDSAGGQVEDAMAVGDFIAESRWTIWVREGSVCHSACVFVLGAGDTRLITGRVGIHRIIRMSSTATTRAELNTELRAVYDRVQAYLERNGVAVAIADLMMAVPNRNLRLLTVDELQLYGLDGVNPAQDDLDRLRLMRKCGQDFVRRRDSFARAFDARCKAPDTELEALSSCGLDLRRNYGFPDETCPAESPLSEFDSAADLVFSPLAPPPRDPAGPEGTSGSVEAEDEGDGSAEADAGSQSMNPPD